LIIPVRRPGGHDLAAHPEAFVEAPVCVVSEEEPIIALRAPAPRIPDDHNLAIGLDRDARRSIVQAEATDRRDHLAVAVRAEGGI
jgi:hypothetical protein